MNRTFKAAVAALIVAVSFAGSASAGPLEDGQAAYYRGDYVTAFRLLRPFADKGEVEVQFNLGFMYSEGLGVQRDYVAAATLFRKAADQGEATSQFNLGLMYQSGHGVPQDYSEAFKWFRKAARSGLAEAQVNIGAMYRKGKGVPQDYAAAVMWDRKAADQGNALAQANLGFMYANGYGVEKNYATAISFFQRAADQGRPEGQVGLGAMYGLGQGVPQDYVSAYMWFNLAAARGHGDAAKLRDIGAAKMTAAQIAEAQKRSSEWRPKMANALPTQPRPKPSAKKPNSEPASGTAFFVSRFGDVLTNAHVIRGCRKISVTDNGQNSTAQLLARDDKNDLALLATSLYPTQEANWRLQVRQGEDIAVYGFPLTGILASSGNISTGNVTALAGFSDDSRFLQISAPVQPGNSGGPLLDRSGTVVGVVVAKLNALEIASATGDIPQNVNFAIKASVAAAFLDAQRVAHPEGGGAGALSTPDIAERAKAFTVQVICVR
jgi:TPR repeat protein